jgi:hypothetical protein
MAFLFVAAFPFAEQAQAISRGKSQPHAGETPCGIRIKAQGTY